MCIVFLISPIRLYALKIVSLTPSVTKQLIVLGLKDSIVGCTSYCPLAGDKSSSAVVVGTVSDINIETILKLKPDLVFANSLTNSKAIEKLKRLGIRVEIFEYPKRIEDIFDTLIKLGEYTGKVDIAHKIFWESKVKLKVVRERFSRKEKQRLFFVVGINPLFTVAKDTYIDDMIGVINCENVSHNLISGMISKEYVLKSNPDAILIMDMGVMAQDVITEFKKYGFLNFVKNDKFLMVNADRLGSPALPDFIDLIDEIGIMVHGFGISVNKAEDE
ncbi:ABC transporter substrate-binding protein [Deferribacteraceae bacterium V6Fe1]|nr:ABC transporter substrate-binding protein [Deferribacteraceae bacterium V6Fe1]